MSYVDPISPKKNRIEDDESMPENGENNSDLDDTVNEDRKKQQQNGDDEFKVPPIKTTGLLLNESALSTKCEVSQTSVGLGSESMLESSIVSAGNGREETDSGTSQLTQPPLTTNPITQSSSATSISSSSSVGSATTTKEVRLSEANAAVIGQQPPVESLNVKQVN